MLRLGIPTPVNEPFEGEWQPLEPALPEGVQACYQTSHVDWMQVWSRELLHMAQSYRPLSQLNTLHACNQYPSTPPHAHERTTGPAILSATQLMRHITARLPHTSTAPTDLDCNSQTQGTL